MSHKLLEVTQVVKVFGGFRALDGVTVQVDAGEILGIVGPNGSGKTTLINVISGLYRPDRGTVHYQGRDVTGWNPTRLARRGINRTFQLPKPFKSLTVEQNVDLAAHYGKKGRPGIADPLEFAGLSNIRHQSASQLTTAQQKALDLARALATAPDLLLVDELAAGLNPVELDALAQKLLFLAHQGMGLIVIEHLLGFVNQLTQRVVVMNAGREIFEGTLTQAAENPEVVAVYMGE